MQVKPPSHKREFIVVSDPVSGSGASGFESRPENILKEDFCSFPCLLQSNSEKEGLTLNKSEQLPSEFFLNSTITLPFNAIGLYKRFI
jgi:hypothetical protein